MTTNAEQKAKISPAYKLTEEKKKKLSKVYKPEELLVYGALLDRIEKARIMRGQAREEFDDMTYEQDYFANKQALNSYLRKKKNKNEVRINTGTTEKKIEIIHNELLQLNLQPTIFAYDDEDNEIAELGQDMSDILKRTNEIEADDDLWIDALQELLSQRALFLEEEIIRSPRDYPRKKVISGLRIYLGDISLPAYRFNEQPYIVKHTIMPYARAKQIFERLDTWKYVQAGLDGENLGFDYKLAKKRDADSVEILHYYSAPEREYQVLVNGVMMLPIGTKLPWKFDGYNIRMIVLKPMDRDFAYGKPLTASAKTLQALDNETIRLLIHKFRQAIWPPIGVRKGKVFDRSIWDPARVTQGIVEGDFTKLIDHNGVTASEFEILRLIEDKVKEFVGSADIMQGIREKGKPTATEVITLQRQAVKMLGLAVYAWGRAKREMSFLRIYNVLENYTQPLRYGYDDLRRSVQAVYRKFTVRDTLLDNNKRGRKIIQFTDRNLREEERRFLFEREKEQEKVGEPVQYKFINVKKLRLIKTNWHVVVEPKPRESSELQKILFTEQLKQAAEIASLTGKALNTEVIIEEFERRWSVRNFFQEEGKLPQAEQAEGGEKGSGQKLQQMMKELERMSSPVGEVNNQIKEGALPAPARKLSVNNLIQENV